MQQAKRGYCQKETVMVLKPILCALEKAIEKCNLEPML